MIRAVESSDPPLRLVLGADAVGALEAKLADVRDNLERWREMSIGTAFDRTSRRLRITEQCGHRPADEPSRRAIKRLLEFFSDNKNAVGKVTATVDKELRIL